MKRPQSMRTPGEYQDRVPESQREDLNLPFAMELVKQAAALNSENPVQKN